MPIIASTWLRVWRRDCSPDVRHASADLRTDPLVFRAGAAARIVAARLATPHVSDGRRSWTWGEVILRTRPAGTDTEPGSVRESLSLHGGTERGARSSASSGDASCGEHDRLRSSARARRESGRPRTGQPDTGTRPAARGGARAAYWCRDVFLLRKIQGLPQREIAMRLNISENTVETLVARGARRCADYMRARCGMAEMRRPNRLDNKEISP